MKQKRTWVLIADARRARVFQSRGKGTGLTAVQDMALDVELSPSRALGTDRPGRTFESVGSTRHAMENPSDPHREQERQFAQRIASPRPPCRKELRPPGGRGARGHNG